MIAEVLGWGNLQKTAVGMSLVASAIFTNTKWPDVVTTQMSVSVIAFIRAYFL